MTKIKTKKLKSFKTIETHLRNYRNYQAGIKNLQNQLDYILPNITAKYEIMEGSVGSFVFKSTTEDFAIDRIEGKRALQLHEDIAIFQLIIDSIDVAIKELDPHEKEFVKLRYLQNWSYGKTALEMGYTERNLFFVRNNVRDKLLISLKNVLNLEV